MRLVDGVDDGSSLSPYCAICLQPSLALANSIWVGMLEGEVWRGESVGLLSAVSA
jgi:hypothetical protein